MTHTAHHPILALSGQLVARVWRLFANRQKAVELTSLTDEQLRDIGLTRGDVRRALTLPLHTDPTSHLKALASRHDGLAYQSALVAANSDKAAPSISQAPTFEKTELAA
ncbi:MAG: DUF1127 domain-containing protein [Roseibium sp.]